MVLESESIRQNREDEMSDKNRIRKVCTGLINVRISISGGFLLRP
jgi:hypothetical protein